MMRYRLIFIFSVCVSFVLTGCSSDSDLEEWMAQQREEQASKDPIFLRKYNIAPPAPFDPYPYHEEGLISPFDPTRITMEIPPGDEAGGNALDQALLKEWLAEENRMKEPLESIPLESMAMVGVMMKNGQTVALVKVDGFIHPVKTGEYLGLDKGKIQQITETSIDLRELVKTGQGNVMERFQTLRLQEGQS